MLSEQDQQMQKQRHIEQLRELKEQSQQSAELLMQDTETQEFDYYHKVQHPMVNGMNDGHNVVIEEEASPAEIREETRYERKKRTQREQRMEQAREKALNVTVMEAELAQQRQVQIDNQGAVTKESISAELALLKEKLEAIKLNKVAALESLKAEGKLTEDAEREIEWRAQADAAAAAGNYAIMLPPGSKERTKAMATKENEELKADKLKCLYKVTQIENPVERAREEATIKRHDKYDTIKSITKFFSADNPLTHEDAIWEQNGKKLVNVGRAFFGGTKPMYIFEDRNSPIMKDNQIVGYKKYLFKTAVNCLGLKKPEGALVTEAASQLQRTICGDLSIPAFAAMQEGGVLGSFQEKIERSREPEHPVDLFKWQANPSTDLPATTKEELLREHMLDWLLCNFDTKGENFLQTGDGNILSFDKEASFSFITKEGAQHMDTEYIPHSNTTIYNVLFTQFAQGKLDLNLQKTEEYLANIEDMSREDYLRMFGAMLTQKYGEAGEDNAERRRIEDLIWSRKDGLREEYRKFYTGLINRRRAVQTEEGKEPDHTDVLPLGENQLFRFARAQHLVEREQIESGVVPNVTTQQIDQHGAASFKQVQTKAEAERLVADSHGFLYMKDIGRGLFELHPTMPETAVIDGREVKLRQNYNRYVKMLMKKCIGDDGQPLPGAEKVFADSYYAFNQSMVGQSREEAEQQMDQSIDQEFRKFFDDVSIFGEEPEEAIAEFRTFMKSMLVYGSVDRDRPNDMNMLTSALIIGEHESAGKNAFTAINATRIPLEERLASIRTAMEAENKPQEEIEATLEATRKMYADADAALQEMAQLREMAVDTPDIALINACSANASTMPNLIKKVTGADNGKIEFRTWTHVAEHAQEALDWIRQHQQLSTDNQRKMERLEREIGHSDTCTEDQARELLSMAGNGAKYEYHQAPVISRSGETTVTVETFAAETSQLAVSAFTRHIAIGVYKGGDDGMKAYYRHDNPFASEEAMHRCVLKEKMMNKDMPGDQN